MDIVGTITEALVRGCGGSRLGGEGLHIAAGSEVKVSTWSRLGGEGLHMAGG